MLLTSWLNTLRGGFGTQHWNSLKGRRPSPRRPVEHGRVLFSTAAELLEDRTLLSVGPDLIFVTANFGDFVVDGQVRSESPRELTFQFAPGEVLDASTLDGIVITRAGSDGTFDPASVSSDFDTAGAVTINFEALQLGPDGNNISIAITKADRGAMNGPKVRLNGSTIDVELNTNAAAETTAQQLVDAINDDLHAGALVRASVSAGDATTKVAGPVTADTTLNLSGANDIVVTPGYIALGENPNEVVVRFAETLPDDHYRIELVGTGAPAFATTDFNTSGAIEVEIAANRLGTSENGIEVVVTKSDRGGSAGPGISVAGRVISIDLNTNSAARTTAEQFVDLINDDANASLLVSATQLSGPGNAEIASPTIDYSPLILDNAINQPLFDTNGNPFGDGVSQTIDFRIDLGAQIVAVVPQPVVRVNGVLEQRRNQVEVYFNEDTLNVASAENPRYYQLVNTADDSIMLPTAVAYDTTTKVATLTFANDLPDGTFRLRVGASDEANDTLTTALNAGSVFNTSPYQTQAFLGDQQAANDIDLYRFEVSTTGNSNISVSLFPDAGVDLSLRLFGATGMEITSASASGAGGTENILRSLVPGTYFIGVSSDGNHTYVPVDGSGAAGGTSTGSYRLNITNSTATSVNDANSSFASATGLGTLGAASFEISSAIQPQLIAFPAYPGGNDEPGHRNIPPEDHGAGSGVASSTPNAITVKEYNFKSDYGSIQGVPQQNGITENQKNRAREIFEIYGQYLGIVFVETASSGLTIATGDPRVANPTVPPTAVGGIANGSIAIMNGNLNWGSSEFGGGWMHTAFHEIGHSLGLGHSYDIPSVMGSAENVLDANASYAGEPIFPGDHDLVHLKRIERPDSTDIDLYQFNVIEQGWFSAETVAERRTTASHLNTVLTLYRETMTANGPVREVIARNDDYFSNDSFIGLQLEPGTYYVGVTSTGNTDFDPNVADSGFGGTSDGAYELKLNFQAHPGSTLVDTTGTAFDGDADGSAGGVFDFWFNSGNTIFVDKANDTVPGVEGDGSLANPYDTISAALAAAGAGDIVRIVGNGGGDGDLGTVADARPYLIGEDSNLDELEDGRTFEVPKDVTVMIDAGAVLKLFAANIDVGSSAQGIDRSGGALQVLGTSQNRVYFTSYANDAIGGDSDGSAEELRRGNWGGLVFRDDSDKEDAGTFLNVVNWARLGYGGGQVRVNSVRDVFTPIHLETSRPTIAHNIIAQSADAAISADPNSFEETADRVGPDIHGNQILNNSINGLFVRIRTAFDQPVDRLDVSARWDDTDIVYVLTENLHISGTPGGLLEGAARLNGRLAIDPGVIVKLESSRIEAEVGGSQLIAEGTEALPIIFTSQKDDRYGAGGSFDTSNDGSNTTPQPGQWGGLIFNATSSGSIDHALIAFAGGSTPIEGNVANFNAIEVRQAEFRLTNSLLENNANGQDGSNRNGRGPNRPTTIFVAGAQPIIVDNVIRNNSGSVISINANALQSVGKVDYGRSTGFVDAYTQFDDNHGPLVRMNLLAGQDGGGMDVTHGMEIRGAELTTETIWDDTDIVHVLNGEILINNHHTFSGIRLQSSQTESLVVKLGNANAGFTANGIPLDIDDRIGGTIQIVGRPGFPVVLTSLHDDTVGAGFDTDGLPLNDTNGNGSATSPAPRDWRSIRLDKYSNDRNVAVVQEAEKALTGTIDVNASSAKAQFLGDLAPNEKAGDDNRPLGFEIHGFISPDDATDIDTYSFTGVAGTEVWLDIDRTASALDSVLELVSADGTVLARSITNTNRTSIGVAAGSLIKDAYLGGDYYTTNPNDAGMRVILPGIAGSSNTYFVRVRSNTAVGNITNLEGGLTSGEYQLQVRLQQRDEKPGSNIRLSDIRYATNGIEIFGLPAHSPLLGEASEKTGDNNSFGAAQPLGNLLTSDQNVISTAGRLSSADDIDWYTFELGYDMIQSIGGVNGGGKTWSTIFDIDYADGLVRADTIISVFDSNGNLILISRDSNIDDDRPAAGQGNDFDDLTRGTVGTLDPYIGSVQMPAAAPGGTFTYYVAISSNRQLPTALNATFTAAAANPLIRLEPVNSIDRVIEDHIGFTGYRSGSPLLGTTSVQPTGPALFDIDSALSLSAHVTPFTLDDVVLYVSQANRLRTVNPFNGGLVTDVGAVGSGANRGVQDIAIRSDGRLFSYQNLATTNNTAGTLIEIDPGNAAQGTAMNDSIPNVADPPPDPLDDHQLTTDNVDALAFRRTDVATYDLYYSVRLTNGTGSALYRANPANGSAAFVDGEQWGRKGGLNGTISGTGITGTTRGMAFLNGTLYGVSSGGQFYTINTGTASASLISDIGGSFAGLATGPPNLEGGAYANLLFAITTGGELFALNTSGVPQPIFAGGATSINTGATSVTGLAFSNLDFNLWHPTMRRSGDAGHGINDTFDNSRVNTGGMDLSINGRDTSRGAGGASFYFGLENYSDDPQGNEYFDYNTGNTAQYGILSQSAHEDLTANPAIGNNYNLPGGALGSLTSNSFSLDGYDRTDKPTLYFNYFLETQNANSKNDQMRDSARVFISSNGGATWSLLATNNSATSDASFADAELPSYKTTSRDEATANSNQRVQELYDNTGGWRQARVDLADFAGAANLTLRFDFATAGEMNQGLTGDGFGDFNHAQRGQNNAFEGFYIDDIIVGFAERGEMVTGAQSGATSFFAVPQNPSFSAPQQSLVGEYQLELRRGTEYVFGADGIGTPISSIASTVAIFQGLLHDTNDRLIPELGSLGDRNTHRAQGHVQIDSNSITNSSQFGIVIDAAPRDAGTGFSHQASVRNLPTLNNQRLVPGVKVVNNVVANSGTGGIFFSGDPNSNTGTQPTAAVPYGRIVNNTIYGSETPSGIGIQITQNASPTLLNNIFANNATAISVDGSSNSTVATANLFSNNNSVGYADSKGIFLTASDPLFVNASRGNYYLADGSLAIDSSLNTLGDRPNSVAVKSPLGIPASNFAAPAADLYGQLRVDDPNQDPPPGLGSNIFKDRGAVERADFLGPVAALAVPQDNVAGVDLDPADHVVWVSEPGLDITTGFVIELIDTGIGIDDSLIDTAQFQLRQNGVLLVEGVDYIFQYNANTNRTKFIPIPGTFPTDNRYTFTIDRSAETGVLDLAGNRLSPNNMTAGTVEFSIVLTDGVNDPPINELPTTVPETDEEIALSFSTADGNAISVSDRDAFLGTGMMEVTLAVTNGVLTLGDTSQVTFSVGDGTDDAMMTFGGTIDQINAALDGLAFTPAVDYFGTADLTITTSDLGNFGGAGPETSMDTLSITVNPLNDAPAIAVPLAGSQMTDEDQPLTFSVGSGNPIVVSDVDAGSNGIQITLIAENGTISLDPAFTGLTFVDDTGTAEISEDNNGLNDTIMRFQGTIADINAALDGLVFSPNLDFFGTANLFVDVDDLGNTGPGGPLTASEQIDITVNEVNKLTISDASIVEGDVAGMLTFNVNLLFDPVAPVTVQIDTQDGTATVLDGDFTAITGLVLTFNPGESLTQTVNVVVNDEQKVELDESFLINLSNANVKILDAQGVGSILNDDQATLSIANSGADEDGGPVTFTVTLSDAVDVPLTVDFMTADIGGQAVSGTDYTTSAGTLNFAGSAGETQTFEVTLSPDSLVELDETFAALLGNIMASGRDVVFASGGSSAVGTVRNDDMATLSIDNVAADEDTGTLQFTVTLTGDVDSGILVDYATADIVGQAVAGTDYTAKSGTLNFVGFDGEQFTVTIDITPDATYELDELFAVNLSNIRASGRNVTLAQATGIGTIVNDDPPPTVSIIDAVIVEGDSGNSAMLFTVSLSAASFESVMVDYSTIAQSATADVDYVSVSNATVLIAAGQTSATVSIEIIGDKLVELDETFEVVLSNPTNATIDDGSAIGQITNDDQADLVVSNPVVDETAGTVTFMVTLDGNVDTGVDVDYATQDIIGQAFSGSDYVAKTGSLSFSGMDGETQTITIDLIDDNVVELSETFRVQLLNLQAGGRNVVPGEGIGTITDNDVATVSIGNASGFENSGTLSFTVTLNGRVDAAFNVAYMTQTIAGQATSNVDYNAISGNVTFAALGNQSESVTITLKDDANVEPDELFEVVLGAVSAGGRNITVVNNTGTGTIRNDDGLLSISDAVVREDAGVMEFTVTLAGNVSAGVTVQYATADIAGQAISGVDYLTTGGTLNFSGFDGETRTIQIPLVSDDFVESDETFEVNLTNPAASGRNIRIGRDRGIGTIRNDDATLNIDNVSAQEDSGALVFTVTLSGSISVPFMVDYATVGIPGQADPGVDFIARTSTLSFAGVDGESKTISVTMVADSISEGNEQFELRLSNITFVDANVRFANASGFGTILNDDIPQTPTIFNPANLVITTDATPTFEWSAVQGAARYDIWVNDLTIGVNGVIRNKNVTSTSFTPSVPLTPGHSYIWTVRAIAPDGTEGNFATHEIFTVSTSFLTVDPTVAAPSLINPGSATASARPTFQWMQVLTADRYDLWVNDLTTGENEVIRNTSVPSTAGLGGIVSYVPNVDLVEGHSYIWTVRAVVSDNVVGEFAAHSTFAILGKPTLIGPQTLTQTQFPTFQWTAVPGAARYDLWVNDQTTGQSGIIRRTSVAPGPIVNGVVSYTHNVSLPAGHSYIWTVRATNSFGTSGDFAAHQTFTILGTPALLAPSGTTFGTTPTFQWIAVAGAARYDIWVNDLTTGQSGVIRNMNVSAAQVGGVVQFTSGTPLTSGHDYLWTVRAINSLGQPGDWATHRSFHVASNAMPSAGDEPLKNGFDTVPADLADPAVPRVDQEFAGDLLAAADLGHAGLRLNDRSLFVSAMNPETEVPAVEDASHRDDINQAEATDGPSVPVESRTEPLSPEQWLLGVPDPAVSNVALSPSSEKSGQSPYIWKTVVVRNRPIDDQDSQTDAVMADWALVDWWNDEAAASTNEAVSS